MGVDPDPPEPDERAPRATGTAWTLQRLTADATTVPAR